MGRVLECVGGYVSNVGATLTQATISPGQTNVVRGTDTTKPAWLLAAWAFNATAGELQIRSPKLHDNLHGIRNRITANNSMPVTPYPSGNVAAQRLYQQDALIIEQTGGAAEIDNVALLIEYDDLAGSAARFIDNATLDKFAVNQKTVEVTVTAVATGVWGGATVITNPFDELKANEDYAIVGFLTDTRGCAVGITGPDFGNFRVGGPCEPSFRHSTARWFADLSAAFSIPLIPVFNSANRYGTYIDVLTNQAGGSYVINLALVELGAGSTPGGQSTAAGAGATLNVPQGQPV